MSAHKSIDRICVIIVAISLILAVLFCNGQAFGIETAAHAIGYENRLFDRSRVHSFDIVMDNWSEFIENCESETYYPCTVIIDGEAHKNVGIRAKGNTSLSSVKNMNSSRYSFKIEFDQYDKTKSYHGLDKVCLNNIIQDNTYMKDYVAYSLMADFGVDAPLCSYANITVNGENWGLYLAVEAIEDSFLKRNYGNNYGDLYKPDALGFGGGRGNGKDFRMSEFMNENSDEADTDDKEQNDNEEKSEKTGRRGNMPDFGGGNMPDFGGGNMPDFGGGNMPDFGGGNMPDFGGGNMPDFGGGNMPDFGGGNMPDVSGGNMPDFGGGNMPDFGGGNMPDFSGGNMPDFGGGNMPDFGGGKGGFGMGSSDVKLQYTDDEVSSYSNIFNNAKTTVTEADQTRLIAALKALSEQTDLENTVDVDEVIRYFVVHDFLCNGDSYTGQMIHNYYLYEKDGQLSMIPWDYNLAYGSFMGSNASSSVNSPIDTPVSNGMSDRPMVSWIFDNEKYTEQYHTLFRAFLESVDFEKMITETVAMIDKYVQEDSTKFCTYEDYLKGVSAITKYCTLREESVNGQLDGTIPATSEGQKADSSALIKTGDLNISDMGTMNMGGKGGGFGRSRDSKEDADTAGKTQNTENTKKEISGKSGFSVQKMADIQPADGTKASGGKRPEGFGGNMPEGFDPSNMPEGFGGNMPEGFDPSNLPEGLEPPSGRMTAPSGKTTQTTALTGSKGSTTTTTAVSGKQSGQSTESSARSQSSRMQPGSGPMDTATDHTVHYVLLAVSAVALLLGVIIAAKFRR